MEEMSKYKIPKEILAKFTDDFWKVFHDELTKIFGDDYTSIVDDDYTDYFDYTDDPLLWYTGTFGWHKAFTTACKKFNLNKVLKYYDKLEWYDSDMFDGEICELLQAKFLYRQELDEEILGQIKEKLDELTAKNSD